MTPMMVELNTYARTTSFRAFTRYFGPPFTLENSTPTAHFFPLEVSKIILVTCDLVPTVRLGRESTSEVKYAVSVVTLLDLLSMYVTGSIIYIAGASQHL